jgi:DNA-directed RNA polymerase alpha subunit
VSEASDVLVSQLTPFSLMTEGRLPLDSEPVSPILDLPIEDLGLSQRVNNLLRRSKLSTIGSVLDHTREELLALRNFGELGYNELISAMSDKGFPMPEGEQGAMNESLDGRTETESDNNSNDDSDDEPASALAAALRDAMKERSGSEDRQ